ncbi:hypothetical protein KY366_02325 [Candidatus Woesearchaeota archaeon]|nr:hypothetical protein [Candidatus Woesearchaeota archaeon]
MRNRHKKAMNKDYVKNDGYSVRGNTIIKSTIKPIIHSESSYKLSTKDNSPMSHIVRKDVTAQAKSIPGTKVISFHGTIDQLLSHYSAGIEHLPPDPRPDMEYDDIGIKTKDGFIINIRKYTPFSYKVEIVLPENYIELAGNAVLELLRPTEPKYKLKKIR